MDMAGGLNRGLDLALDRVRGPAPDDAPGECRTPDCVATTLDMAEAALAAAVRKLDALNVCLGPRPGDQPKPPLAPPVVGQHVNVAHGAAPRGR